MAMATSAADDGEVHPDRTAVTPFIHKLIPQVVVHLHGRQSVTEDWLIENSTLEIHAFHIHQVHFRDVTQGGTGPNSIPLQDVITVPAAPLRGSTAKRSSGVASSRCVASRRLRSQSCATLRATMVSQVDSEARAGS